MSNCTSIDDDHMHSRCKVQMNEMSKYVRRFKEAINAKTVQAAVDRDLCPLLIKLSDAIIRFFTQVQKNNANAVGTFDERSQRGKALRVYYETALQQSTEFDTKTGGKEIDEASAPFVRNLLDMDPVDSAALRLAIVREMAMHVQRTEIPQIGAQVKIAGLVSKAGMALNGATGMVTGMCKDIRVGVTILKGAANALKRSIKNENLEVVSL